MSIELPAPIAIYVAAENRGDAHTVEPLASVHKDGKTVVTNRLSGNFPGSPIELQFIFELDGNKIASLEIRS